MLENSVVLKKLNELKEEEEYYNRLIQAYEELEKELKGIPILALNLADYYEVEYDDLIEMIKENL